MKKYKAFLFDLNGTMIDDMSYHVKAWRRILNDLGANLSEEAMKQQAYGKNHELIERVFPNRFTKEEQDSMVVEKETQYQEQFRPHLKLIDGLQEFMDKAKATGIKLAVGSAAIPFNVDFVLDGLKIRKYFSTVVTADDVEISKPNPETWFKCAKQLNVATIDCLVFEDAVKGAESAENAGMDSIVLTTLHEEDEFADNKRILGFIKNYNDPLLSGLI